MTAHVSTPRPRRLDWPQCRPSFELAVAAALALASVLAEPPSVVQQTLALALVVPAARSRLVQEAVRRPAVARPTTAEFHYLPMAAASCHQVDADVASHPVAPVGLAAPAWALFVWTVALPTAASRLAHCAAELDPLSSMEPTNHSRLDD
jgi:hypothetical protein